MQRLKAAFQDNNMARATVVLTLGLSVAGIAPAYATHKVYGPIVEEGETELELRGHYNFDDGGEDGAQAYLLGAGRGFTSYWFSEFYVEVEKEPGESPKAEAVEWENRFQLTEQGEYWLDVGLLTEFEFALEGGHPDSFSIRPLLQKGFGNWLATGNLIFEREFGDNSEDEVEFGYAWQIKHPLRSELAWGIEGYGSLGELTDFAPSNEQAHELGPGLYGELDLGTHEPLEFRVLLLFGLSDGAPDQRLVFSLEYEF